MELLDRLIHKYCQPYRKYVPVQLQSFGELSRLPMIETIEGGATLYGMIVEHFEQI